MKKLSKDHVFSFSAISGFAQCPLSFKLKYLEDHDELGNGFSDFGTFCHKLLEMYSKKLITASECPILYAENFAQEVVSPFPAFNPRMKDLYFDSGYDYFSSFNGFGDKYEVSFVEQRLYTKIGPYNFWGIIDLVLKDKEDGRIVIIDHKTKSERSMKKELELYKKQLYLYAHLYIDNLFERPKAMGFNMIRTGEMLMFDFDEEEYHEALRWAEAQIDAIFAEREFEGRFDKGFCYNICGLRGSCPLLLGKNDNG